MQFDRTRAKLNEKQTPILDRYQKKCNTDSILIHTTRDVLRQQPDGPFFLWCYDHSARNNERGERKEAHQSDRIGLPWT